MSKPNMYAILVKDFGKPFDYYPDPLYESLEKAQQKVNYLMNTYPLMREGYKVKKLSPDEIKEHDRQWKKWVSMID